MIIWINGVFGSGKTSVATKLCKMVPNAYLYDPEEVGFFIRKILPMQLHEKNFQNHKQWRSINLELLEELGQNYQGITVVPMTVVNENYFNEIVGELRSKGIDVIHYALVASLETLGDRLYQRGDGENSWIRERLESYSQKLSNPLYEKHIDTNDMTVEDICQLIIKENNLETC